MPASPPWARRCAIPPRTIPRAIPIALVIALVVYAAVAVAVLAVLGPDALASSTAPLADVVTRRAPGLVPVVRPVPGSPRWVRCWH